jgi:hypothetical protein
MLCSRGGGSLERASLVTDRVKGAGRVAGCCKGFSYGVNSRGFSYGVNSKGFSYGVDSDGFSYGVNFSTGANFSTGTSFSVDVDRSTNGGVLSLGPSKRAASDAVLSGRTVAVVEADELRVGEGMFRVGDEGGSAVLARLFSHGGGFCEAVLAVACRRLACEGVVGVSFGFSGELFGVKGRTVDGEASRIDPGRRKGDWRGLLEKRGEGLYGVGVVDCSVLAAMKSLFPTVWRTMVISSFWCCFPVLRSVMSRVWVVVLMMAPGPATSCKPAKHGRFVPADRRYR